MNLCCTWTCLLHRGLSCNWICLDSWTTGDCNASGRVYESTLQMPYCKLQLDVSTPRRPKLHLNPRLNNFETYTNNLGILYVNFVKLTCCPLAELRLGPASSTPGRSADQVVLLCLPDISSRTSPPRLKQAAQPASGPRSTATSGCTVHTCPSPSSMQRLFAQIHISLVGNLSHHPTVTTIRDRTIRWMKALPLNNTSEADCE
jgi:hypothetical protein